jgi:hypothetical protein
MSYSNQKAWALLLVVFLLVLAPSYSHGQDDQADLAKQAQNPLASMSSFPLQNNTNFYVGPQKGTQNVLNIQPVLPFSLGANWNLVTRTIFPIVSLPGFTSGGNFVPPTPGLLPERINGLGDTLFTAFLTPKVSKLIWGVGPALALPTATDDLLASDKWSLGPSVVLLTMPGHWVIGTLLSNIWSFAGSGTDDVNSFTLQYFINYNMPGGSYFTSQPIITANWGADSGDKWTIPFGGGLGKIFKLGGKQPVNFNIQAYYNVKRPEFGGRWQLRVKWVFLFPKG